MSNMKVLCFLDVILEMVVSSKNVNPRLYQVLTSVNALIQWQIWMRVGEFAQPHLRAHNFKLMGKLKKRSPKM